MLGGSDVAKAFLTLSQHPEYRVIRRIPEWKEPVSLQGDEIASAVYVDVETEGLDYKTDKVLEISMVPFTYGKHSGVVSNVFKPFQAFNDPGRPIAPEITELTGITDDMVRGHKIDADEVEAFVSPFNLVVSHHAEFDRKFCERVCPEFANMHWACSESQVPWKSVGISSTKLDYIAYRLGWFYEAHRSTADCLAGINILSALLPKLGKTAMLAMLETARKRQAHIWATNTTFDESQPLKRRGYYWSPGTDGRLKAWHKTFDVEAAAGEVEWLTANIYNGRAGDNIKTINVTSLNRFSERD